MPKPRLPVGKAKLTGAALKDPKRHANRSSPTVRALGAPPSWLSPKAKLAWGSFKQELAWLTESDRAVMEIASTIRGRFMAGEDIGVAAINQLRMCLSQMGATPADRSKITVPDEPEEDPASAYLH